MFRIEAFVDDKRLSQLLHAMTGIILGEPKVQPVANGTVKNGKAVPANSGAIDETFRAYVKKHKLTEIAPQDIKRFAAHLGGSSSSYSHYLDKLKKLGVLKKKAMRGNATIYSVVAK